jgi:VanZ family protein
MLRKLAIAGAWSCLAFIIYATLSSIDARPVIAGGYFTILERFGAYAVLGFLFHLAYPRHLTFVCIMVFGGAVVLELLQNFVPDRDPRFLDAVEKLLGGTVGLVSSGIFQSFFAAKQINGNDRP